MNNTPKCKPVPSAAERAAVEKLAEDLRASGCERCGESVAWFEDVCAECRYNREVYGDRWHTPMSL